MKERLDNILNHLTVIITLFFLSSTFLFNFKVSMKTMLCIHDCAVGIQEKMHFLKRSTMSFNKYMRVTFTVYSMCKVLIIF